MVYNPGPEPVITLPSGLPVLLAVYQSLASLERDGYRVWIDDDQDVRVEPHDLHADISFVLVSNADDLARILADQIGPAH